MKKLGGMLLYPASALQIIMLTICIPSLSCRKDAPTQPDGSRGMFVQKIAFTSWAKFLDPMVAIADLYNDNGAFRLYNRQDLTPGLGTSLSPDAMFIAFIYVHNGLHVMRVNKDGAGLKTLLSGAYLGPQTVNISPDGSELLISYADERDPGFYFGIMPVGGGEIERISAQDGIYNFPKWSPDGDKIVFVYVDFWGQRFGFTSPDGKRAKAYIASINRDGTNLQFISDTLSGVSNDFYPSISPDGQRIAFISQRNHPDNIFPELFVMDSDGSNVRQLTQLVGGVRHGDHFDLYTMDREPKWIKDSKYIYFRRATHTYNHETNRYNEEIWDLYIIKADGTGLQNITNDGVSSLPKRGK